ncbi:MAG TPA: hypothetical protein VEX88_03285 [Glaciibacter sp.]|nr:hypothetical protein [Glaciibacter sp.]
MADRFDESGMSELEQEFELQMSDDYGQGPGSRELEGEFETLFESREMEDFEPEASDRGYGSGSFAERLYELSQGEFESEAAVDREVNNLLSEMESEYFWGSIKKLAKKIPVKRLVNKGLSMAASRLPAFQALKGITQLARGDLKGMLGQFIKAGLGTAVPGAAPFLPAALSAFGFEAGDDPAANREAWDNVVGVAQEAYEYLAENLDEEVDDPMRAGALANEAFQTALRRVNTGAGYRYRRGAGQRIGVRRGGERVIRVRLQELRPGQEIVLRFE